MSKTSILRWLFLAWCLLSPCLALGGQDEELESLNTELLQLYQQGKYTEVIAVGKRALEKSEEILGAEHPQVAVVLTYLAIGFFVQGQYAEAQPLLERALRIQETSLGPKHPNVAKSLHHLGQVYYVQGRYAEAKSLFERALRIQEAAVGLENPEVASLLTILAEVYLVQGQYAEAQPLLERALRIQEAALGPEHPNVVASLHGLGRVYFSQGRYAEAEPLYQRALQIQETALGPEHQSLAVSLHGLGQVYFAQGRYAEAEPLYQRVLEIREIEFGTEHPYLAGPLSDLALLYMVQGNYAQSEPLYQRAIRIQEAALGPKHPNVATSLHGLGQVYFNQGRYAEAEPLYQRALRIQEATLGPEHPNVALDLNVLAQLRFAQGQPAEAEPLWLRSIRLQETTLGPEHQALAVSLHGLAQVYFSQGLYAKAEPLYQRALRINEGSFGLEHSHVATTLGGLAQVNFAQGQYAQAESLYQRALRIQEAALGVEHPDVGESLLGLAQVYFAQGQYAEAKPLLKRALGIQETAFGPKHPDVPDILNTLAEIHQVQGQYAQAERLFQRALKISEATVGPDHPLFAIGLNHLAQLYGTLQRYSEALTLYRKGLNSQTRLMHEVLSFRQEETEKFQYVQRNQVSYFQALSLIYRFLFQDSVARALGLNLLLARKGLVLESQTRYQEALAQGLAPALQQTWQDLQATKARYGKLLGHRDPTLPLAAYRDQLGTLQQEIADFESTLTAKSGLLADVMESQGVTLKDVAARLPSKTVLVEMVRIPNWNWDFHQWTGTWQYVAFVLDPNGKTHLVDLGKAAHLEMRLEEALGAIRQEPWLTTLPEQLEAVEQLNQMVWKPLLPAIGNANTVIVSPDGLLNLVPFAAIYTRAGRFVVEDFTIITVSSGRDLVKGAGRVPSVTGLFVAADPAFDLPGEGPRREKLQGSVAVTHSVTTEQSFARLTGTMREAKDIPPLVPGEQKVVVLREQATEGAVLEADRPRILHLATHGFFLKDRPSTPPEVPRLEGMQVFQSQIEYENPLTRSGLAFAGANFASRTTENRDGLLTALEVTGMDLYGTELVVLSACDTGTGEVRNGEGVYGLRRAFALAGARNLVMSLWPVWDRQAMKQMRTFYTKYGKGLHPVEALRQAQLERIQWFRKYTKGEAPPSVWAPFVIQINGALPK